MISLDRLTTAMLDGLALVLQTARSWLEALLARHEDELSDARLLARHPDVATLSDEDIHDIAQGYASRTDYHGADMKRVRDALFRLRGAVRCAAARG